MTITIFLSKILEKSSNMELTNKEHDKLIFSMFELKKIILFYGGNEDKTKRFLIRYKSEVFINILVEQIKLGQEVGFIEKFKIGEE